jgi:hypothetical protein
MRSTIVICADARDGFAAALELQGNICIRDKLKHAPHFIYLKPLPLPVPIEGGVARADDRRFRPLVRWDATLLSTARQTLAEK